MAVGLLGKILGPVGFVWAAATGRLPLAFGLVVLANDVLWWPAFVAYLRRYRLPGQLPLDAHVGPEGLEPAAAERR